MLLIEFDTKSTVATPTILADASFLLVNPKSLISKLYGKLTIPNKTYSAKALAKLTRSSEESVKATLRDLRKKGFPIQAMKTSNFSWKYRLAA